MSEKAPWKSHNRLLDRLPADVCARLRPHLHLQDLPEGKVIYKAGVPQSQVYFLRSGAVSLLFSLENGDATEIGMIGNEGMAGSALMVDSQSTPTLAVVQIAGQALCLKSEDVDREFSRASEFQIMLLRYNQVLIGQMAQTAVCNRYHTLEKQLSRWLLACLDRAPADQLDVTQETIASRLGVRREGVTEAAGRLQQAGIIEYSRGKIRLIDRAALESRSCECYRQIRNDYDRLMAAVTRAAGPLK